MQATDTNAPEQTLPPELTGNAHGWFTRYRRYPVFSTAWARGRSIVFASVAAIAFLALCLPMLAGPADELPLGGIVQIAVQIFVPLLAGPWLGAWVRRQAWPPQREWPALVLAVLLVVLGLLAFHQWAAEPTKQWLAERTGRVDANGQRRKIAMAIGVIVTPMQGNVPRPPPDEPGAMNRLMNTTSSVLLSFWLAGGLALWGWRREQSALAALARERELAQALARRREAELRLSVLAAQVEPHFLFNTLAGVRSAIATDPTRASEMIDKLVDYLRAAIPRLRSDGSAQATVGGQFDIVRAYLGLMHARMPRLAVSVQAPPDLLNAHCPPLMLISLAENAVKHGVEMKIGNAQVAVRAERTADGNLALTVEDDGVGFGTATGAGHAGSGLGLTNVRERLAQLYGERASLTLKSRPQGGIAATLTLPLDIPTAEPTLPQGAKEAACQAR
jgi:signal transduction histidine kinase